METKTFRTSTIVIAAGGKTHIYKSRSEMTPELRQSLQRTLNSSLAATVLIADQRGRNEILKSLRGEPSALRGSPGGIRRRPRPAAAAAAPVQSTMLPAWLRSRWTRAFIAFLLPAAVGAGFYALLSAAR